MQPACHQTYKKSVKPLPVWRGFTLFFLQFTLHFIVFRKVQIP